MKYVLTILLLASATLASAQTVLRDSSHFTTAVKYNPYHPKLMFAFPSGRQIDADSALDKLEKLVFLIDRIDSLQRRIEYLEKYSIIADPKAPKQGPTPTWNTSSIH